MCILCKYTKLNAITKIFLISVTTLSEKCPLNRLLGQTSFIAAWSLSQGNAKYLIFREKDDVFGHLAENRSVVWLGFIRSFGRKLFGHLAASKLKIALGVAVADVGDHVVDEREFGLGETA